MVEERHSELEKKLGIIEKACLELSDENKKLVEENEELKQAVSASGLDFEFLKYAAMLKFHKIGNKEKIKPYEDYENWEKGLLNYYKKQCSQLTSLLFRKSMGLILDKDKKFKKVPFFYHDFYSGETIYTPGVLDLFGIKGDEEELSVKILARKFIREEERERLTNKLKRGESIENYVIQTSYKGLGHLSFGAYPLKFGKEAVGFGAFLYNPDLPIEKFTALRFGVYVRRVIEELGEEFKIILRNRV